ncbi:MAG TPA: hypothetical protein VH062_27610 [Polyangiaceae bacterium]|jgi:hypothetical protein|nr:hypothetical protein [Polyangiaceae bacterium]
MGEPFAARASARGASRRTRAQHDEGHVTRSLVYFGDAEAEPLPDGLDAARWDAIKRDLEIRVLALSTESR